MCNMTLVARSRGARRGQNTFCARDSSPRIGFHNCLGISSVGVLRVLLTIIYLTDCGIHKHSVGCINILRRCARAPLPIV